MNPGDVFSNLALPANLGVFAAACILVWFAGVRISRYASAISDRTGLCDALLGLLLLGGVTSLPEVAASSTSAWYGNADLAVNNILGGVSAQILVLALADFIMGRKALTSVVPDATVLLQNALSLLLLVMVILAITTGDFAVLGTGVWAWAMLLVSITAFWMLSQEKTRRAWIANADIGGGDQGPSKEQKQQQTRGAHDTPFPRLIVQTCAAAAVILAAGYVLSLSAEAIAAQTGLGASFVGMALLAVATSLPEFSTVLSAARMGLFTMAISDVLGANIFDLALLFPIDAIALGEPVFNRMGDFSVTAAALGAGLTTLLLIGLAERRDRTVLSMGVDSIAILLVYGGGLYLLYTMR